MEKETAQTDTSSASIYSYIQEGTPEDIRERYASLAQIAKSSTFGKLDEDVVILDTETTGFSYSHDELTQIAAARLKNGNIQEWFVTFVNPGKPIPEEVARLTNIYDHDVADAPSAEEALGKLVEFVGTSDIVAHNSDFDKTFVTRNMFGAPLGENAWIDSLDLARIAVPRLKSHRLIDLAKAFDTKVSTHRADADVEALCSVYRILLAAVQSLPDELIALIGSLVDFSEWNTAKIFKHFAGQDEQTLTMAAEEPTQITEAAIDQLFLPGATKKTLPPFSLRQLRKERVSKLEGKVKTDADAIAADTTKSLVFPRKEEMQHAFQSDGLVGGMYKSFEARAEQLTMAEEVRCAFISSTNVAIEAGTGVGKSMAYLLPEALTAQKNNITVGIATKTNALLDQLIHHELPLLNQALKKQGPTSRDLVFTSLKGYSHYPCLRRIDRLIQEEIKTRSVNNKELTQAPSIAALLSFIEQSEYDDMDSLKIDYRVLPRYLITTKSHDCLRRKCPFYGTSCFVHGARRRAESSDIVVTNHTLLFCDSKADGGLLPPIRYWIVDEAHGTEVEARRAFSLELSADEMNRLAQRVASAEPFRNVFIRAERRVAPLLDADTLFFALTSKAKSKGKDFKEASTEFAHHIKDLLFFDQGKSSKGYEFVELWLDDDIRGSYTFRELASYGRLFIEASEKLITVCQDIVAFLEDVEEAADIQREIASVALDLKDMLNTAETILFKMPQEYAYSATLSKKKDNNVEKLQALLVNVGEKMNETLFANTHSVVFASATLTIDGSFDSFETALGLNTSEHSRTTTCEIGSSYDYDTQMKVYVANDMPEPNDSRYLDALQRLLIGVHLAQQGSMLTLFTNRREMEKCYDVVHPVLKDEDLRVVCQKWGVSVKGLRDDFLADEHLSLFALKSFWEGFDAPGATLKGVVIPKLPFSKPTDPLSCERAQRDDQAWRNYVLPSAVLETKQAAGRLIRGSKDSGCLILADKRLLTKGYGKTFLNSLPSKNIKVCSSTQIIQELSSIHKPSSSVQ